MMSFETPGGKDARRVIVSLLALVLVVGVGACGGETAESRTSFDLEIVAKTLPSGGLKSDDGYTVTLREAKIVLGPLRFYSGEPLFSRRGSSMTSRILLASSLAGILWDVPEAQAHPGHYQEGDTLAEWLEMRRVDLLAITPTRLGQARGVTGSYRSM
ncbi:MAG: hypothetical protein KAI47_16560, partial [Deltaproteobacteria bacterium]|nr:hypothetical protein [Deltaproteobacteria bacterium]